MPGWLARIVFTLLLVWGSATAAAAPPSAPLAAEPPLTPTPAPEDGRWAWDRLSGMQVLGPEAESSPGVQTFRQKDLDLWSGNLLAGEIRRQKKAAARFVQAYLQLLPSHGRWQHRQLRKAERREAPCPLDCLLPALASHDPGGQRFAAGKARQWALKQGLLPPQLQGRGGAAPLSRGEAAEVLWRYWKQRRGDGVSSIIRAEAAAAVWRLSLLQGLAWKDKAPAPPPLGRPVSLVYLYADESSRRLWSAEEYRALLARLKNWGVGGVLFAVPAETAADGGWHWPVYPFRWVHLRQMIELAQAEKLQVGIAPRWRDLSSGQEGQVSPASGWDEGSFAAAYQEFILQHAMLGQEMAVNALVLGQSWNRNFARVLCHADWLKQVRKLFKGQLLVSLSVEDIDTVADTCLRRADLFELYENRMREPQAQPADKLLAAISFFNEQTVNPLLWRLSLRPAFEEQGLEVKLDQELVQGLAAKPWFGGQVLPACPLRLPHLAEGKSPVLGAAWPVTCSRPWPL